MRLRARDPVDENISILVRERTCGDLKHTESNGI